MKLYRVRIGPGEAHAYKQPENMISPGDYFATHGRIGDREKKLGGAKAAVWKGKFIWLFPSHIYVLRLLRGYIPPEPSFYGTEIEFDKRLWPDFDYSVLWDWQKRFLLDAQAFFKRGYQYRRGTIVKMGGGKTLLGLLLAARFQSPVVLAPTYLHQVWKDEAQKWGLPCPWIVTYQSAHKVPFTDCLIVDEANAVSNPKARQTQRVRRLAESAHCVVPYTGTPISVSPMQIRWINVAKPGVFPDNDNTFKFIYGLDTELREVVPGQKVWITETWDMEKITRDVAPYVETVDTRKLFQDIPDVEYRIYETPKPRHFDLILAGGASARNKSKILSQVLMTSDGHILNDMNLPQHIDDSKLKAVRNTIENIGEPVFVVAHWSETIRRLKQLLKDMNPAVVGEPGALQRFLTGQTLVLIAPFMMTKGLNLHEVCRITLVVSNGTSPLMREQMESRTYRPGQRRGCIFIDFCAKGTLDRERLELLKKHREDSEEMIERALLRKLEGLYVK